MIFCVGFKCIIIVIISILLINGINEDNSLIVNTNFIKHTNQCLKNEPQIISGTITNTNQCPNNTQPCYIFGGQRIIPTYDILLLNYNLTKYYQKCQNIKLLFNFKLNDNSYDYIPLESFIIQYNCNNNTYINLYEYNYTNSYNFNIIKHNFILDNRCLDVNNISVKFIQYSTIETVLIYNICLIVDNCIDIDIDNDTDIPTVYIDDINYSRQMHTSLFPTQIPTMISTSVPSLIPTVLPTNIPTLIPTQLPTYIPTHIPTQLPTMNAMMSIPPTQLPTKIPTKLPTFLPTINPITKLPSILPTMKPTTLLPTIIPTNIPTINPTQFPTKNNKIKKCKHIFAGNINKYFNYIDNDSDSINYIHKSYQYTSCINGILSNGPYINYNNKNIKIKYYLYDSYKQCFINKKQSNKIIGILNIQFLKNGIIKTIANIIDNKYIFDGYNIYIGNCKIPQLNYWSDYSNECIVDCRRKCRMNVFNPKKFSCGMNGINSGVINVNFSMNYIFNNLPLYIVYSALVCENE